MTCGRNTSKLRACRVLQMHEGCLSRLSLLSYTSFRHLSISQLIQRKQWDPALLQTNMADANVASTAGNTTSTGRSGRLKSFIARLGGSSNSLNQSQQSQKQQASPLKVRRDVVRVVMQQPTCSVAAIGT